MKNPTGLTSVTFRHLSVRQIIDLTCQAGGQGIEWGSDVHVKPEDLDHARMTGQLCRQAGLDDTKSNPRCLRRLYLATQAEIRRNMEELVWQEYAALIEEEDRAAAWTDEMALT